MKLTFKVVKRASKMNQLAKSFAAVRASYVKAGVLGTSHKSKGKQRTDGLTNAQLASIHEYGLGDVPARPWIGPPFRANRQKYMARLVKAYKKALKDGEPAQVIKELERLGFLMAADIKNYVTQSPLPGVPPPNAPATIARKGSSRTLVDSSQMVNSVTHQVIDRRAAR